MKKIVDCETGEIIERELTAEELEQETKDAQLLFEEKQKLEQIRFAEETQRQAILDRLGLTEEEAKLLLG